MSNECQTYLETTKLKLATSAIVREIDIVQESVLEEVGFFRARLWLINGDFLEVNASHHPKLSNFPHHVHVGNDKKVEPSQMMNIFTLIEMLEHQIKAS